MAEEPTDREKLLEKLADGSINDEQVKSLGNSIASVGNKDNTNTDNATNDSEGYGEHSNDGQSLPN